MTIRLTMHTRESNAELLSLFSFPEPVCPRGILEHTFSLSPHFPQPSMSLTSLHFAAAKHQALGLRIRDLSVGYGDEAVLSGLTLDVPPGASVAIVGESGCGKTTLLTTIAGLKTHTTGSVAWFDSEGQSVVKPRSSFVWQHLGLLPWKTVRENLMLPFRLANAASVAEDPEKLGDAMIRELGLESLQNRWPASLSGGQRQRLALGRALIAKPDVLFMDEPFSALDALRRERLQDFLAGLRRTRPVTTIFVTHDIGEAVFLASHIVLLRAAPSGLLDFITNPAWSADMQCADRDDPRYLETAQRVHSALRRAARAGGD